MSFVDLAVAGNERSFKVLLNGEQLLANDEKSARMIFGNLTGLNYARSKPDDFFIWLGYMQLTHPLELAVGRGVSLVNADGVELQHSTIGEQLMRGWNSCGKFDWKFTCPSDGYQVRLHFEQRDGSPAWIVSHGEFRPQQESVSASLPEAYQKAQSMRAFLAAQASC